jgi:hypothetical protein
MEEEKKKTEQRENRSISLDQGFELLDAAGLGQNITVRDDQYEKDWIFDAAEMCRKKGYRFRLIDTGRFERTELMWLIGSGLDIYTDDRARKELSEIEELALECLRKNTFFAYLHTGEFEKDQGTESSVFSGLCRVARYGTHIYLSNREVKREAAHIEEVSVSCMDGNTQLVYYHHGPLEPVFAEAGKNGAWIHISEKSIEEEQRLLLKDLCHSCRSGGGGLIVHLEDEVEYEMVEDLIDAGAYVLFLYGLFDYKSPFRKLKEKAEQKDFDFKAYYLQHDFFL